MTLGLLFALIGLLLIIADAFHLSTSGIDIFSGASFVTETGEVGDAPAEAGGISIFDYIPAYMYSLVLWVMASLAFAFLPLVGKKNSRRLRHETE